RGLDFISMYHRQKSANYTIYRRGPGTGTRFLVFNMNGRKKADGTPFVPPHKLAWFRDRRFRRAVAHAIDRDRIRKTIFHGFAYTQNSPVSEANTRFFSGARTDGEFAKYPLVVYEFNLEKANALLDEMGMTGRDGEGYRTQADASGETHRVEFLINTYAQSPEYQKIASIMKDDLKAVGIKVNAQQIPFAALVRKLMREWDWETIIIGLTGGYSDPMNGGRNVWPTTGNLHMWNPRQKNLSTAFEWEKELNSLFEQAQKTPSEAERQLLAARFQHIVTREVPLIYTVQSESITAVRNRFGNFNPSVYSLVDYMMIFDRNAKLIQQ
ncbi:MAG: hypothetical protein KAI66_08540, partial [Lentisphaeria bacterium]|nr:hypothetical protein [Lentisphaeria bacterium]